MASTQVAFGLNTPAGTMWSLNSPWAFITVWPALLPPPYLTMKVGILREEIDDFTFTFVAPLGADDCYYWHLRSFRIRSRARAVGEYNTGAPLPPARHTIFSIRGCYALLEIANRYSISICLDRQRRLVILNTDWTAKSISSRRLTIWRFLSQKSTNKAVTISALKRYRDVSSFEVTLTYSLNNTRTLGMGGGCLDWWGLSRRDHAL